MPSEAGAPIRLRDFIYSEQLTDVERDTILRILHAADDAGVQACVVGGAVRDWLMGERVVDIDVVVEADAIPFARALESRYGGHVHVYEPFRTTTWFVSGLSIDLTTARTETYVRPAALPEVRPASLAEDFRRRDFTVNAMALRLSARWLESDVDALLDPHGGLTDLRDGVLRAFHARSFIDDPTRIIRAARYQVRFNLELEPRTRSWLDAGLSYLPIVSGERLKYDLELHFAEPLPERTFTTLRQWDVFRALGLVIAPEDQLQSRFEHLRAMLVAGDWDISGLHVPPADVAAAAGWAALTYNMGQHTASRLLDRITFERHIRDGLLDIGPLSTLSADAFRPDRPVSARHRLLQPFGGLGLFLAWLFDRDAGKRQAMWSEWAVWRHVRAQTTGDDLRRRGLRPGPRFKRLLDRLRDGWLDGELNTVEDETRLLDALLASEPESDDRP